MNRAASVARVLLVAAILPATAAAGYLHASRWPQPAAQAVRAIRTVSAVEHVTKQPGFVLGTVTANLADFDRAIRHRAALRIMFFRWGTPVLPQRTIIRNARHGATTVIELLPAHLTVRQIGEGHGDWWLRKVFAAGLHAVGKAVIVSFGPEMNGQWYAWGFGHAKPSDYVRAWRHVHDLLSGSNVGPLITWLWQPSAIHFSTASPRPWWPGSRYVDEIGLDGYYVLPIDNFDVIFAQTIRLMRRLTTKPITVGETAVGATTGHQAADIRNLFAGVRRYHLRGFVWFNMRQSAGKYHQDWRLQDHPAALRAFIAALARTLTIRLT